MSRRNPAPAPQPNPLGLLSDRLFQVIMVVIGAVFLFLFNQPEKNNAAMSDVREKLATIVTGLSATRDDIGKLSDKLDTTADGLADTKAEVAGIKSEQSAQRDEMARLRDRMRDYEDGGAR